MNNNTKPINEQISKLINPSTCIFKLHSNTLNVIKISEVSILKYYDGDFGEWNVKYEGNANLSIAKYEKNNLTQLYKIEGYAKVKDNTVIDIDKTISSNKAY